MTDTPQDQPLWETMRRAYDASPLAPPNAGDEWTDRYGNAAEIRAVADWLVPEEAESKGMRVAADTYSAESIRQHQRQTLRQRLLAEADRAERGEE